MAENVIKCSIYSTTSSDTVYANMDEERPNYTVSQLRVGECSYVILFQYGCIVSSSSDGSVKVWSQKGTEITTLHGHTQCANDAALLVSVSKETMVDEGGYPQLILQIVPTFCLYL